MLNKLLLGLTVAAAFAGGCGGDGTGPGAPLEGMALAKSQATALGEYLAPVAADVDTRVAFLVEKGMDANEARRIVFTHAFGSPLALSQTWGGSCYEDAFRYNPEAGFDSITTFEGYPVLIVWSIGSGTGLFYQPTFVHLGTGAVYQGLFTPQGLEMFGPRTPHDGARVQGWFDSLQVSELERALQQGLRAE